MTDNTRLNPGSSGDLISTDSLGGSPEVKVQRVKVQHGADGSATDASTAAPLPVVTEPAQVSGASSPLWKVYSGTVAGGEDTLDFNADLGRDARSFALEATAGDATVAVSADDGATWSDEFTIDATGAAASFSLDGLAVNQLRITDAGNAFAYTVIAY